MRLLLDDDRRVSTKILKIKNEINFKINNHLHKHKKLDIELYL
jgi:hypothetical protein